MMRDVAAALVLVAVCGMGTPVLAATELRFSHSYTEDDTRHAWAERIAELVAQKTNGEVTVKVYPNQQLFKARAQYDGLAQNRIDIAIYPLPWLSGKAPLTEIGALPGLVTEPMDGVAWRERQIWPMLQEAVRATGVELAGGGWTMATIGSKGEPILAPADMKGHKMRGLGKATEAMMRENGATVTSLPASEIYQALQTGVLTAVLTNYESFDGYNLHEVIDHLLVGRGFAAALHGILVAPGVQKKVGEANYAKLMEAVAESEPWFAERTGADTARIAQDMERRGVTIHHLTEAQLAAWQQNARETAWVYFKQTVPNGEQALNAVETPR